MFHRKGWLQESPKTRPCQLRLNPISFQSRLKRPDTSTLEILKASVKEKAEFKGNDDDHILRPKITKLDFFNFGLIVPS